MVVIFFSPLVFTIWFQDSVGDLITLFQVCHAELLSNFNWFYLWIHKQYLPLGQKCMQTRWTTTILQNPESKKLPNWAQLKVQEFHTTQSLTCNLKIMPWKTKRHTSTRCMFGISGNSHLLGWSKDQVSPLNHLQSGWSQIGMDRELYQTHKRDVVNTWNLNGMNICHIYTPKKTCKIYSLGELQTHKNMWYDIQRTWYFEPRLHAPSDSNYPNW